MNKLNKINFSAILEWVSRCYVWLFLMLYGLGKIFGGQFYLKGELPTALAEKTVVQATPFEIAWTFMGLSKAYILFIGISQIVGATFLLFNRTKILGVILLMPIMINIVVFDLVFMESKGPVANATIYILMLFYILYYNKDAIVKAWLAFTKDIGLIHFPVKWDFTQFVIGLLIAACIFSMDQFFVQIIGHGES